jgi:hypothetical protein
MKSLLVLVALLAVACGDSDSTPDARIGSPDANPVCHNIPFGLQICERHCLTQVETFDPATDCCDDVTCNCVPSTAQWELHTCNGPPPPDAGIAPPDATE